MGYHIVLENWAGGELDGRFASNEEEIGETIIALAKDCIFTDGDVIRVIKANAKPADAPESLGYQTT